MRNPILAPTWTSLRQPQHSRIFSSFFENLPVTKMMMRHQTTNWITSTCKKSTPSIRQTKATSTGSSSTTSSWNENTPPSTHNIKKKQS
mmetsp:Transcript_54669/g.65778  ORF Transcript_54669/g.65778 Transcript_54669/m.65778 type:complete len:89 (+) Transcript_54669:316-582(+)